MINNEQHNPPVSATPTDSFQSRVQPWMMACFGAEISADGAERNHRFLEESLELVQACGCTASEAHQLVEYVYGRPVGEREQEVGGVMVTLAALCLAQGLDMHAAGETELARIWTKVEAIRAKQAAKPKHSPLPAAAPQPIIGRLMDQISALPVLWGLNEPGALLRNSDVFRVLAVAGREQASIAAAPQVVADERGLPPLPEKHYEFTSPKTGWYTAAQMQAYARSALQAAPVQAQEPVAWRYQPKDGLAHPAYTERYAQALAYDAAPVPLYRAPVQLAAVLVATENVDVCAEMRTLCSACGGAGDVHRADGEWLGECTCIHVRAQRQAIQAEGKHPAPCARDCEAQAFKNRVRERDARIAQLEARLVRRRAPLSPEAQQAIAAARAAGQTIAATPGGLVFLNSGAEPGSGELDCPACGGSGHAGDLPAGSTP